jgi:D-alanine--poly(phosphoribitol) ligase subunit 1
MTGPTNPATVIDQIAGHAVTTPERPAVKDLSRSLTYAQLLAEVDAVAAGLEAAGVGAGDRVALHMSNSADFAVAALAVMRVRAIFVPLSVADPEPRLAVILDDCEHRLVVTGRDDPEAGLAYGGFPAGLARHRSVGIGDLAGAGPAPHATRPQPADAAYAIYTSGTTGTPKGVLIGNGAFLASVRACVSALDLTAETRTLCVSPFHFDGSFGTLFPTLFAGGSVYIPPRDSLLFPRTFFNAVTREAITYTGFSPSYLRVLLGDRRIATLADSPLEVIALGGEASTLPLLEALWAAAPRVRIFNRYGPTETTIAVTHCEVSRERVGDGPVPIGRPHPNVTFHVVGDGGELVSEPGVTGELYVGGDQLMTGYWRAPQLSEAVLRTDIVPGQTVYRTGDLVYRDQDGDYVYVDRADRVIKRSGIRISLVEVGGALSALPVVADATCVAFSLEGGVGIAAFVVAEGSSALEIKRLTAERLPATMLPDQFVIVDEFPLTSSSKVDERRLLAIAGLEPLGRSVATPQVSGRPIRATKGSM